MITILLEYDYNKSTEAGVIGLFIIFPTQMRSGVFSEANAATLLVKVKDNLVLNETNKYFWRNAKSGQGS